MQKRQEPLLKGNGLIRAPTAHTQRSPRWELCGEQAGGSTCGQESHACLQTRGVGLATQSAETVG